MYYDVCSIRVLYEYYTSIYMLSANHDIWIDRFSLPKTICVVYPASNRIKYVLAGGPRNQSVAARII